MTARIIDGKTLAELIHKKLQEDIQKEIAKDNRAPGLAVVMVGNDPASAVYVSHKQKACKKIGINSQLYHLPNIVKESELLDLINKLNADALTDGILVQLPLPPHINSSAIVEHIHPHKDVDGFHPSNVGLLMQRQPRLRPCTPYGIMQLLEYIKAPVRSQKMTIVGASNIVGRPLALEGLLSGATVTVCHRFTKQADLIAAVQNAEILIVAIGKPGVIDSQWIKEGAIVIDVGITRDPQTGTLHGDVDFASAAKRASWITPVPGGVGPMTVAILLQNTFYAYRHLRNLTTHS